MTTANGKRPKLSPAERARLRVLAQEARAERQIKAIERALAERDELRACMEDGYSLAAERATNDLDRWECEVLNRLNEGRPPSRRCRRLPGSAYEAKRLMRYAQA